MAAARHRFHHPAADPIEEGLKLAAAKTRLPDAHSIFLLVSLFGIFELMVAKSTLSLDHGGEPMTGGPLEILAFTVWIALPVLMHGITAMIYAYFPGRTKRFRFWTCVLFHWAFNQSRRLYLLFDDVVSPATFALRPVLLILLADMVLMGLIWLFLIRRVRGRPETS